MIWYAIIGGIGFLFLVFSFIIGELADSIGDFFDHSVDTVDHDAGHVGPSFFSVRALAAFITGFGVVGYLLTVNGWTALGASLPAIGTGAVMMLISWGAAWLLFKQQASGSFRPDELVGKRVVVSTSIPSEGYGEVSVVYKGSTNSYLARSLDGKPIEGGQNVTVRQVVSNIFYVSKK